MRSMTYAGIGSRNTPEPVLALMAYDRDKGKNCTYHL